MSYDVTIFFPQAEFPAAAWRDLLESFRSNECAVRFEENRRESGGPEDCLITVDWSLVDVGGGAGRSSCAPRDTRWQIGVSTTAGRSARASFVQYAIPYHALVFFPGVTVHDCQYHLGRSVEASSWSTAESWLRYAEPRLWRLGPKQALVDLGLFTPEGSVRF